MRRGDPAGAAPLVRNHSHKECSWQTRTARLTWSSSAAGAAATRLPCARAELGLVGRTDREGQGRRHLPAPRLHPDQGAAARRRDRRRRARGAAVRREIDVRRHRHGRRATLQGRRGQPPLQGSAGPGEGAQDQSSKARAGWSPRPRSTVGGQRYEGRHVLLATGSYSAVAARPRDRRQAGHHQRAGAAARPGPDVGRGPRRRRDRRRVRQRLEVLRRRGHDRRGAAPPGPAGGRGELQAARARVPPPRHQLRTRRSLRRRQDHRRRRRVTLEGGKTLEAELLLVAVGRGPVSAGLGYEEDGVAIDRGFVLVDEYCQTSVPDHLRGRRPASRPCSWPTSASPRASWSPSTSPACRSRRSTTTAFRASPTPSPRSRRSGSPRRRPSEKYGDDMVKTFTYDLAGNGRSADPEDRGRGQGGRGEGRPGARRAHRRRSRRRTDRRSAADLQLGGAAS